MPQHCLRVHAEVRRLITVPINLELAKAFEAKHIACLAFTMKRVCSIMHTNLRAAKRQKKKNFSGIRCRLLRSLLGSRLWDFTRLYFSSGISPDCISRNEALLRLGQGNSRFHSLSIVTKRPAEGLRIPVYCNIASLGNG